MDENIRQVIRALWHDEPRRIRLAHGLGTGERGLIGHLLVGLSGIG